MTYTVECAACSLSETIDRIEDVLDRQESHRKECGRDHVFEYELRDRRSWLNAESREALD